MACSLVTILVLIIFIVIDLVPLYREKQWMSFWLYTVMTIIILILSTMMAFNIKIPSPSGPLKKIITAIWRL